MAAAATAAARTSPVPTVVAVVAAAAAAAAAATLTEQTIKSLTGPVNIVERCLKTTTRAQTWAPHPSVSTI